mmetsp:Transcript_29764/g.81586  ORF Transcript_29764/g.81586 Transcript_29764/m.81586 type:complete len:633 (-) Transcript_29764:54-1952(-)
MEFVALAKSEVQVYTYSAGGELPSTPDYTFPPVPNKESCEWSSDGNLLGLVDPETGGVTVFDASAEYTQVATLAPLCGGPVRNLYFSPKGEHLVTHERYSKDGGNNVGVWNARTGELRFSFTLKKLDSSWPPLKWTSNEMFCCRMVQDGVQIMAGSLDREEGMTKITAPGIMAFEVAPRGAGTSTPYVAICIAESKGSPAKCQTYNLDNPEKPTATKSFFKAQSVAMYWNNTGTALLVKTSVEVDDTGKNYYGGTNLYFMRPDGQEDSVVATADEGPVHDVQWSPTQDEFVLIHGVLPGNVTLHEGKKARKKMDFGKGHRNTIRFNSYGRFITVGGYGQLLGDTDFWDRVGQKVLGSVRMECCVESSWAPDGRHFLAATTHPRMRVDNKIVLYDYCGQPLGTLPFGELRNATWRPRPRGMFQDRPPSPERSKPAEAKATSGAAPSRSGYPAEPKKQAYRPPGARGAGSGLAALLRSELGSTAAEATTVATKVFGNSGPMAPLPPGASPDDVKQASGASNRNARKKKAKEAAQAAADAVEQEKIATTSSTDVKPAKATAPKEPAEKSTVAESRPATSEENPDVEKKVRALRKKLRDIEKLKEKPEKDLDVLQRQKLAGEADILQQIFDLGADP